MKLSQVTHHEKRFAPVEPYNVFQVPSSGDYMVMLWDHFTAQWDYKPRPVYNHTTNPMPATVPLFGCRPSDFIPMTAPVQRFWFGLIVKAAQHFLTMRQLLDAWIDGTLDHRAFTDQHAAYEPGPNGDPIVIEGGFADYVTGVNLDSEAGPMQIKCLDMAGNIIKKKRQDSKYVYFECIDPYNLPSVDEAWEKPWLVHWATESTAQQLGPKNWVVSRWPQLERFGLEVGFPFPLFGHQGENKVKKARVKPIENGALFSPYNPADA